MEPLHHVPELFPVAVATHALSRIRLQETIGGVAGVAAQSAANVFTPRRALHGALAALGLELRAKPVVELIHEGGRDRNHLAKPPQPSHACVNTGWTVPRPTSPSPHLCRDAHEFVTVGLGMTSSGRSAACPFLWNTILNTATLPSPCANSLSAPKTCSL